MGKGGLAGTPPPPRVPLWSPPKAGQNFLVLNPLDAEAKFWLSASNIGRGGGGGGLGAAEVYRRRPYTSSSGVRPFHYITARTPVSPLLISPAASRPWPMLPPMEHKWAPTGRSGNGLRVQPRAPDLDQSSHETLRCATSNLHGVSPPPSKGPSDTYFTPGMSGPISAVYKTPSRSRVWTVCVDQPGASPSSMWCRSCASPVPLASPSA